MQASRIKPPYATLLAGAIVFAVMAVTMTVVICAHDVKIAQLEARR